MEKYKKNKNYEQEKMQKLITVYHNALELEDKTAVHNAFTEIYYFVEKYVYQTLWHRYKTLMSNPQHREEIIQNVWLKLFDEIKYYNPDKGAITTFISPWISHVVSEYASKSFKKSSVYYANAMDKIIGAQDYCTQHGLNVNDIKLLEKMTGLSKHTIKNSLDLIAKKDTVSYESLSNTSSNTKSPDDLLLEIESEKNFKKLVNDILNEEELKILELYLTPDNPGKRHTSYQAIADNFPDKNAQKIRRKIIKIKKKLENNKKFVEMYPHVLKQMLLHVMLSLKESLDIVDLLH